MLGAACGGGGGVATFDDRRYTASALVLDVGDDHGPVLCVGMVLTSDPPAGCGGPGLVGWSWEGLPGVKVQGATRSGTYAVTGTWDGHVLTLTEPPAPTPPQPAPSEIPDFTTPCPAPTGGWKVVDEATATQRGQDEARAYLEAQADSAGMWIDQAPVQAAGGAAAGVELNDPRHIVLNMRFTGHLERHEAAIRKVWGGSLCVSKAARSSHDLEQIANKLRAESPDLLSVGTDVVRNAVVADVVLDVDGRRQERFDERYGPGVVNIRSKLAPADR